MKTCKICGVNKPLEEFYSHPKGILGKFAYCKKCHNAKARSWTKSNKDKIAVIARKHLLKKKYGLSEDAFNEILVSQNSKCACCGDLLESRKTSHVDHDHVFGHVRGIVCSCCNTAEGQMKTPERVLKLYQYMIKNELFYSRHIK